MYKKLRAIIAVILIVCLVPVSPVLADDNNDRTLIAQKSGKKFDGISGLTYERADSAAYEKLKNALTEDVKISGNQEKVAAEWRELTDEANYASDMSILMDLYCFQDSTNDELLKEKEANSSECNRIAMMYCEVIMAVYNSEYKKLVSDEFGDLTSVYVEYAGENINPELLPLKEEREALISNYMKMMERSYTESEAAGILLDLVNVNQKMAKNLGYDNYLDYAYKNCFSRDYTYENTLEILHGFRAAFMPFVNIGSAYNSTAMNAYVDGKLDNDGAINLVADTAKGLSDEFKESMTYLQENSLLEWIDSNSVTSYMDYMHYYKTPFVAMNKRNSPLTLVDVFAHEYGHFNNGYWHPAQYDSVFLDMSLVDYDVVEIPSTANEFIIMKNCEEFFGEYTNSAAYNCLGNSMANTYYAACVAEVETVAYTEEFSSPEELAARLDDVVSEYYGYPMDIWSVYSHIFENPGYLISYVMAGLSSWEIACIYNENPVKGAEAYNKVCNNVDKHYNDCMKVSGLTYNWNTEKLNKLADRIAAFYIDSEKPVINVEDGGVYFGGVNLKIQDSSSVTVMVRNGGDLNTYYSGNIYLPASDNAYSFLASDNFGNMIYFNLNVGGVPFAATVDTEKGKQTITWNGVEGATGYKLYGSKTGKSFEFLGTVSDADVEADENGVKTFSFVNKNVKSGTWKYYLKAIGQMEDGSIGVIAKSMKTYAAAYSNRTYTNAASIEYNVEKLTLQEGKSIKKTAKILSIDDSRKLANGSSIKKVRYISSNEDVATVNSKGKITAINSGECFVYAVAANGEWDAIAVKVE